MNRIIISIFLSIFIGAIGWFLDAYIDYKANDNVKDNFIAVCFCLDSKYEYYSRLTVTFLCSSSFLLYYFLSEKIRKNEKRILIEQNLASNKYTTIFKSAPLAISLVNKHGILIDCNPMMEKMLGYSRDEIIGKNFKKWVFKDYHKKGQKQLQKIINNEEIEKTEYIFIKKDGELIDVSVNCTSIRDKDNNFIHTLCFLRNVVEEKKHALEMREITDELKHSNQELEQFAYVASHDLQEPLRVVSNYCEMLRDKCEICGRNNDETKKWLNYTVDATGRMKKLIKELLDFSRVGRKDKPYEITDINEIIEDVRNDFEILIKETNTSIKIDENISSINCIKFRIRQLFYNLISNAIKFRSSKKPHIFISFKEEEDNYLFCVKDNGIGISPKYFDRIFGIFKRLYSREEYPGTGIGLALCKKIVETHGGKIWVESGANKGASFYFTLPKEIEIIKD